MNYFLDYLSNKYIDELIIMVCDGAAWHRSKTLVIPDNICLVYLPPYTPEMNPIEQIWAWIRAHGFKNESFATLEKVIDRLCETINSITPDIVISITARDWIKDCF